MRLRASLGATMVSCQAIQQQILSVAGDIPAWEVVSKQHLSTLNGPSDSIETTLHLGQLVYLTVALPLEKALSLTGGQV